MRPRAGLHAVLLAVLLATLLYWPDGTQAQTGEARVQHWTTAFTTTCRAHGGRASIQPDYQTRADLNGDGAPDFILDARRVVCLGALDVLCPNNLCPLMVLLSGPLGDRPSLEVVANGWSLDSADQPPAIVLRQPGPRRFQWDGRTMAEVVPGAARPPPVAAAPPDAPPKDDPPPPAGAPAAAPAGGRPPIVVRNQAETFQACRDSGGRPQATAGFEVTADLNADGQPDYIQDSTQLNCEGAASALCGSAGCPIAVFLSGARGYSLALGTHAQAWDLDRAGTPPTLVLEHHGSFCGRVGSAQCTKRYRWDGTRLAELGAGARPPPRPQAAAPGPGSGAASQVAPGAASQVAPRPIAPEGPPDIAAAPRPIPSGNWEIRPIANRAPLAMSPGPGAIESIALLCNEGVPVAVFTLQGRLPSGPPSVTFAFQAGRVEAGIAQSPGATNRIWYADLRGSPIPRLLAWEGGSVRLLLSGTIQGNLALDGAGRAVRAALEDCYRF